MEEIVIIGGGVAGLCASIRLCEHGITPLLIEGSTFPSHKVCGEFLSPECIPQLNKWGIVPESVNQMHLRTNKKSLKFSSSKPAGAISHISLDPDLLAYARKMNCKIKMQTQVKHFTPKSTPNDLHAIELSTGEIIHAKKVVISTGKIASFNALPKMEYYGIKTHFKGLPIKNTLEMFSFPGAYLGIVPIEDNRFNIACLAKKGLVKESPEAFMTQLINEHPVLQNFLSNGTQLFPWMSVQIPSFGFKDIPNWLDAYFIGDAIMTIPPASGSGLSLAILGGCFLADQIAVGINCENFHKKWRSICSKQLFWAKCLHKLMLNPTFGNPMLTIGYLFPQVASQAYKYTRLSI